MMRAPLSALLEQSLAASPRARELCTALSGKCLQLEIAGLPGHWLATAAPETLQVDYRAASQPAAGPGPGPAPDVTVSGTPLALLALATAGADAAAARGGLRIGGDEQLAARFQELAQLLRPDGEALASRLMGRIPAHLATRAAVALGAWGRSAAGSVLRTAGEYLAHESRDLVPRAEAEGFLGGVEALRAQLARAEARAAQLEAALDGALGASRGTP